MPLLEPLRAPAQVTGGLGKFPLLTIFFRSALLLIRFLLVLAAFGFAVLLIVVCFWHARIVTAAMLEND